MDDTDVVVNDVTLDEVVVVVELVAVVVDVVKVV